MSVDLSRALGLHNVSRVGLRTTPLALAVCQLRFSPVLSVARAEFVASFQAALADRYPLVAQIDEIQVQVTGGTEGPVPQPRRSPQWQLSDLEDRWKVVLAQDFCAVETRAYDDFSEFLSRLREVAEALLEHIQPRLETRLGLRYVNEIREPPYDWPRVVRSELLGPLADAELVVGAEQVQSHGQMVLGYPEGLGIGIRYGLLPDGTTVQPGKGAEPPSGAFFLLDFDAYQEFAGSTGLFADPERVLKRVSEFHAAIYKLFRWAVTEEYISTLGAEAE